LPKRSTSISSSAARTFLAACSLVAQDVLECRQMIRGSSPAVTSNFATVVAPASLRDTIASNALPREDAKQQSVDAIALRLVLPDTVVPVVRISFVTRERRAREDIFADRAQS